MIYHNPEGMSDIIDLSCAVKKDSEKRLRELFINYGFSEIETPVFESFDMYYGDNENISQKDIFKLVDKSGDLLVLRPDMTIPACRVAASKIRYQELPYHLFYISKCFRADEYGGGKQREFTQCGIEVLGGDDCYYDALVIKTAIESAKAIGLENISLQIGQVDFFNGLADEMGLDKKEREDLSVLIESKDSYSVNEFLKNYKEESKITKHMKEISSYFGNISLVEDLMKEDLNPRSMKALRNLKDIFLVLEQMDLSAYVNVDLSLTKKLGYYTGMIFTGNTYQIGFPFMAGGRYDKLAQNMGKDLQATGFSLSLEMALMAIERQRGPFLKKNKTMVISFSPSMQKEVLELSSSWDLNRPIQILPDRNNLLDYAKERRIKTLVRCLDKDQVLVYEDDLESTMTFSEWREKWNI